MLYMVGNVYCETYCEIMKLHTCHTAGKERKNFKKKKERERERESKKERKKERERERRRNTGRQGDRETEILGILGGHIAQPDRSRPHALPIADRGHLAREARSDPPRQGP